METPVSVQVVGCTRGVMEGRPWCKVHMTEPFSIGPDSVGSRASDVSADSSVFEQLKGLKFPIKVDFVGDLSITKNGARMKLLRVAPPK